MWPKLCSVNGCDVDCSGLNDLVNHLRRDHFDVQLFITCPLPECGHHFTSAASFRQHVIKWHRTQYMQGSRVRVSKAQAPDHYAETFEHIPTENVCDYEEADTAREEFEKLLSDIPSRVSLLRQLIEHKYGVPRTVADKINSEVLNFVDRLVDDLCRVIRLRVDESGTADADLLFFLNSSHITRACTTVPACNISVLKKAGYVAPIQFDVVELAASCGKVHPNIPMPLKRPVMHYVPILESIKSYLSHPDVTEKVFNEKVNSCVINDFTGGSLYQNHPLFGQEPHALRIRLYTDELEVCNPIGASNVKHKLACVYFQIENVGTKNLSSLLSIHLAILVKDSYRNKYGYDVVLKPLIDDLKILARDGVCVQVKGGPTYRIKGAVVSFCADNLSSHALAGLNGCFSKGKVCRWCLADYDELSSLSSEAECVLRTQQTMLRHSELVRRDPTLEAVYGVNDGSPLQEIPYFVVPDCLPPDIMHDLFQKIVSISIKAVLRGLRVNKVLNYQQVLRTMKSFPYGSIDRVNRGPGLPLHLFRKTGGKNTIRGSASQKWNLFKVISLALGPHVPEGNVYWKLHLLANRICDIILAVSVTHEMIDELKNLVSEHHKLWVRLVKGVYPPKLHYLLHYPRFTMLHGPLRHRWCMRFESFHLIVKRILTKSNNFINPTLTASRQIQRRRCLEYAGMHALPTPLQLHSRERTVKVNGLPACVQSFLMDNLSVDTSSNVVLANSVSFEGLLVRKNCFNIMDVKDGNPTFLLVKYVVICNGEVVVFGSVIRSLNFCHHLHAFEVDSSGDDTCLLASSLFPAQTLNSYCIEGRQYIKVNFTPVDSTADIH